MPSTEPLGDTLPASWYVDPAIADAERTAIFAREWLVVGRADGLANTGDYVAADAAGVPIVVVVMEDGTLAGYHNVCRHRAGPLVFTGNDGAAEGSLGHSFVCRYHGWAYGLDGSLRSARDFGTPSTEVGEAAFDPGEFGLVAVRVGVWRGLLWANLSPMSASVPPLDEALAPFAAKAESFPMESLTFSHQVVHELDCNWKTYADNYLEGYHVPLVHRALNAELEAKRYEVEVHEAGRFAVHHAPTRDGAVNAGRWLWRWPNLALNLYPGGMNLERFIPLSGNRTRILYLYFFADLEGSDARAANSEVVRVSTEITLEDKAICEAVQRNLASGSYVTGRLSPRHERGVGAFQRWVRWALEGKPSQE